MPPSVALPPLPPPQVVDTLGFLVGRWSVERAISDYLGGDGGTFVGSAGVRMIDAWADQAGPIGRGTGGNRTGGGDRAWYEEAGRLRFAGHDWRAGRTLRLDRQADDAVLV
ncbi:MAG: hypothetical protein ACRDYZ_01335, partial [Acidimicrobiales bacterium]